MNRESTRLDSFEAALLAELRSLVDESPATAPGRPSLSAGPDRPGGRRWYVPAVAAAAVAIALSLVGYLLWPTPAYAVSGRANGKVKVTVARLEGADGLERALAKRGITADITYLPAGKECAPGRYTPARTPGLTLGVSADEFEVTIPPGSVGEDDTFVLSAAVIPLPNGVWASVDFDIAHGAVEPCRVVDGP